MQQLIVRASNGSLDSDPALMSEFSNFFEELFREQAHTGDADYVVASPGYFTTLGIPLVRGRLFDERDTLGAPHAALISESLAREKWPKGDAIGRSIEFGNMDGDPRLLTVIGVVGDLRDHTLESRPQPTIYVNYRQRPQAAHQLTVVMRAPENPAAAISAARQIAHDIDPDLSPRFSTLSTVYSSSLGTRRFSLVLVGIFSWVALLLAAAGIYGVTSYGVAQRTREIGVRMALGASAKEVLRMILSQGLVTAGAGVIVGIAGALILTRWMQSLLFEVSPNDPMTFMFVAVLLLFFVLVSCWFPARRATRVDPLIALRYK